MKKKQKEKRRKRYQSIISTYKLTLIFAIINMGYGVARNDGTLTAINGAIYTITMIAQIIHNIKKREYENGK